MQVQNHYYDIQNQIGVYQRHQDEKTQKVNESQNAQSANMERQHHQYRHRYRKRLEQQQTQNIQAQQNNPQIQQQETIANSENLLNLYA